MTLPENGSLLIRHDEQIKNLRHEQNELKTELGNIRESVESLRKSIYLAAISFAAGSGGIAAAILKALN